jgi:hypothetical protein
VRAHDFRSIEQDLSLVFSLSLDYPIQKMRMQIVSWSSFINLSWFLMILGRRIGVHWRCKLKFLFDSLYPPMVWWRAVLLCLSVIRQPSWLSRKEPHWLKLHLKWLGDVILQPWLFMVSWDIVGSLPMIDVCWHKDRCHDVVASSHPCPYYQRAR